MKSKEEFYRKRVFLCGSTRFPAPIGFYEGTFLFGHALRVSVLQISVYLDIGSSNMLLDVDQHTYFIFP